MNQNHLQRLITNAWFYWLRNEKQITFDNFRDWMNEEYGVDFYSFNGAFTHVQTIDEEKFLLFILRWS